MGSSGGGGGISSGQKSSIIDSYRNQSRSRARVRASSNNTKNLSNDKKGKK